MSDDAPDDDDPVTLKAACEIVFRGAIKPSTLRSEARKGNLYIKRIGRADFTTLRHVRELMKCRDDRAARGSTSTRSEKPGSSATDDASSAQAALMALVG